MSDFSSDRLSRQFIRVWKGFETYQKGTIIGAILALTTIFSFLILDAATGNNYSLLLSSDRMSGGDVEEIQAYFDTTGTPYEMRGEGSLFVPADQVHKIRMDLASMGLPRPQNSEGYELFDSNTWIRGEKELQVLEIRALKGQLEKDLSEFDNVRTASVILDIALPRMIGSSANKTKASVILNLMPGARISPTQLRSITFHIAGAVRGLSPNMIAISDTSGKLYQSLDPQGTFDNIRLEEMNLEDRLKAKIDGMLAMIVGLNNYYSTVQVVMNRDRFSEEVKTFAPRNKDGTRAPNRLNETPLKSLARVVSPELISQKGEPFDHIKVTSEPGKIERISVSVLVDRSIAVGKQSNLPLSELKEGIRFTDSLEKEISNQLRTILQGYNATLHQAVDFVEFDQSRFSILESKEVWNPSQERFSKQIWIFAAIALGTALLLGITIAFLFQFFGNQKKKEVATSHSSPVSTNLAQIRQEVRGNPKRVAETLRRWATKG